MKKVISIALMLIIVLVMTSCSVVNLSGIWYADDGNNTIMTLDSDDTFQTSGATGTYIRDGNKLILNSADGYAVSFEIQKSGSKLILIGEDNNIAYFPSKSDASKSAKEKASVSIKREYDKVIKNIVSSWGVGSDTVITFKDNNTFVENITEWDGSKKTYKGSYSIYFDEKNGATMLVKYVGEEGSLPATAICEYDSSDGSENISIGDYYLTKSGSL